VRGFGTAWPMSQRSAWVLKDVTLMSVIFTLSSPYS